MLDKQDYRRYSRQLLVDGFDETAQQRLQQATVLIAGIGGLGCTAAQFLAGSGVGHLILQDPDRVEISNLPRQILFGESDIGRYKTEAAKRRLLSQNSATAISTVNDCDHVPTLRKLISEADIVLDCTDNLTSRFTINHCAYTANTPLIIGAASGCAAQFIAFHPELGRGCYACLYSPFQEQENNCLSQGVLGPVVAVAGLYQALVAMQYLARVDQPKWSMLHVFDARRLYWKQFNVPPLSDCQVCGGERANLC